MTNCNLSYSSPLHLCMYFELPNGIKNLMVIKFYKLLKEKKLMDYKLCEIKATLYLCNVANSKS